MCVNDGIHLQGGVSYAQGIIPLRLSLSSLGLSPTPAPGAPRRPSQSLRVGLQACSSDSGWRGTFVSVVWGYRCCESFPAVFQPLAAHDKHVQLFELKPYSQPQGKYQPDPPHPTLGAG